MRLTPWLKELCLVQMNPGRRKRQSFVGRTQIEVMEPRCLLAADISLNSVSGVVTVTGTAVDDQASVSLTSTGNVKVAITSGGVTLSRTFAPAAVTGVAFNALEGNDKFTNSTSRPCTVSGGLGNDTLSGGTSGDQLFGDAGNDSLIGGLGNDVIDAGDGPDKVSGGAGADSISGGAGNDTLDGGTDNDTLRGGDDIDSLIGGDQNDSLEGGNGDDIYLSGGNGNDVVKGEAGNDKLYGSAGMDTLDGAEGNDSLYGGNDADSLLGGAGLDSLFGELGNDTLLGGDDADSLSGSDQDDSLLGGGGDDTLSGGNGNDVANGEAGNDSLSGSLGLDILDGGEGNDSASGGDDADFISGGGGNDTLNGDNGNDTLNGGTGADSLKGGDHDDILHGGDDADYLSGYLGNDALLGDGGDDQLFGSDGRDLLIGGTGIDRVEGQNGDDILIGGTTNYDSDNATLRSLVTSWAGTSDYATRVAALQATLANPRLQSDETVLEDGVIDNLFGNADQDWFFIPGSGSTTPTSDDGHVDNVFGNMLQNLDVITDLDVVELVNSKIPHAGYPTLMREHYALFSLVNDADVTDTAVASGNWSDASIWQSRVVPAAGAHVLVNSGVTVTVDGVLATPIKTMRVDGTLRFDPTVNTELLVETLIVNGKGVFEMGTATAPIADGVRARLLIDGSQPINTAEDPLELGHGLIVHGRATIYGQTVTPFVTLGQFPLAGATELVLSNVPTGWKVGDEVVIAGTDRDGVTDEVRIIRGINGNRVQIDALQFSHVPPTVGLSVHVANMTRNAVIESSNTELSRRGHVMFMHTRKVDVNFVGLYHLGRTDKSTAADDPVLDADGHRVAGSGTNPRGRYALHFHRNGVTNDANPSKVHGAVVLESPGWGYVNHSSFVDFTDNVSYDAVGAGFVTEAGDEIGSYIGNLAIRGEGSGEGINDRELIQDFGHQGDGFWFQGGGIRVENNVASGQQGNGFVFFTRGLTQDGLGTTKFLASNLSDPTIANGKTTVEVGIVPILNFRNNTAYASRTGAATRFHQLNSTHAVSSVIENLTLWNNRSGMNISYTNQTTIRNVTIIGDVMRPDGTGISRNDVTRNIRYENLSIEGYSTGIQVPSRGQNVISDGYFNNVRNLVIRTAVRENRSVLITGNITFGTLTATALRGKIQQNIVMEANLMPFEDSIRHVFFLDSVTLNFGSFVNRRLYFNEQVASFVPFPAAGLFIPAEYIGKTNQQLFTEFGLTLGGAIAPSNAVTAARIVGLLAP